MSKLVHDTMAGNFPIEVITSLEENIYENLWFRLSEHFRRIEIY